ncbi:MAG: hypothetical protein EP329_25205 [Deltaproteobacteria bacterium]|nr:MAG: hypothetical protein EP329_25205 [Deltaproteobacteria bacterium]
MSRSYMGPTTSREARTKRNDTEAAHDDGHANLRMMMAAGGNQAMVQLSGDADAADTGVSRKGAVDGPKKPAKSKSSAKGRKKTTVPDYDATAFEKAPQLKKIRSSVLHALTITRAALVHVKRGDSAYRKWMDAGATTRSDDADVDRRLAHVRKGLEKVRNCLEEDKIIFKQWDLPDDSDEENTYAYVRVGEKDNNIYLGGVFWVARTKGFDSSSGTIVHELTHRLHGTEDHVYGQSGAKKLAKGKPDKATTNADNYEFLAEQG